MSAIPREPDLDGAELHFRGLLEREQLAQPDQVIHDRDASEVVFLWRERKLAVVIEVGPEGPTGVRPGDVPAA